MNCFLRLHIPKWATRSDIRKVGRYLPIAFALKVVSFIIEIRKFLIKMEVRFDHDGSHIGYALTS